MPKCIKIRKKKRTICVGDMRDEIILQNRNIIAPVFGTPDFTENFVDLETVLSIVETVSGKTYFDGVETETPVTHNVYIRFDEAVTAETWVEFNSRRLDILRVEDLDEWHLWQKLICIDRGEVSAAASQA